MRRFGRLELARSGGLALFLAFTAQNVANFIYHVAASRLLGPSDYGGLVALLGILLAAIVPITALQTTLTRAVSRLDQEGAHPARLIFGRLQLKMALFAFAVFVLFAAASPLLRNFLRLGSPGPVLILGATALPVLMAVVPRAVLMGRMKFRPVAISLVVGAMVRLSLAVGMTLAGAGISGAMAAVLFGEAASWLVLIVAVGRLPSSASRAGRLSLEPREALRTAGALASFWGLVGIDVLLARHFLTALESGYYGAAATAGRVALFLPGAIGLILFSRVVASEGRGANARQLLMQAIAVVTVLGVVTCLLVAIFPHLFISILFGERYQSSASIVAVLAGSAAALGIIAVIQLFDLARRAKAAHAPLLGVAAATAGIVLAQPSLMGIALVMLGTTIAVLALMLAEIMRSGAEAELESADSFTLAPLAAGERSARS